VVSTAIGTTQAQTTLTVTAEFRSATTATTEPGALSFTGADVRGPSVTAVILLVLGFVTLAASRRRRRPVVVDNGAAEIKSDHPSPGPGCC
jgi:hypothetical protein